MKLKNWVLDITLGEPYAFCPIEDNGDVVVGLTIITDKCPGNLSGVMHLDGQEAVEKWCAEHPTWRTDFCANA